MSNKVWFNSADMYQISNDIRRMVSEFQRSSVKEFFAEMEKQIGLEPSHTTWNGDQAAKFMKNVIEPRKNDINIVCRNIISYASNFDSQRRTWETFDQS